MDQTEKPERGWAPYWSEADRVRWVEKRRIQASDERWPKADIALFSVKALAIWLAKRRDGLSWGKIALQYCGGKNPAAISKARRLYGSIELHHPSPQDSPSGRIYVRFRTQQFHRRREAKRLAMKRFRSKTGLAATPGAGAPSPRSETRSDDS